MDELSIKKNNPSRGLEENSVQLFQHKEKDRTTEYLSERAKKLTTAVYIVTNLIPQADPLRLSIREFSLKLLTFIGKTSVECSNGCSPEETLNEMSDSCKKIAKMLEISFFSGYVSEMNFSVLKTEFDIFASEILSYDGPLETISRESLKVKFSPDKMSLTESKISKGQKPAYTAYNTVLKSKTSGIETREIVPSRSVVETKKISRKEAIISIIKLKGAVNIRDVSAVVINCSEKTVQRELSSLVAGGILKRAGERRWSVYSLAE